MLNTVRQGMVKTTSGGHAPFSDCVGGMTWLIYWHQSLEASGNIVLSSCAYSTLNNSICHTSTDEAKLGRGQVRVAP